MDSSKRPFIAYGLPDIGEAEIAAVTEVLRSGWVTTGPACRAFEEEFATFLGADNVSALAVNSATSGLHLALEAVGVGPGDEVIAPTLTFTATVEVVRYLGGHPVLIDIDPVTLNISAESVAAAITEKTKAIVVVHYGGLACDMNPIFDLAEKFGLHVIEDAAHALPTTYQNQLVGTLRSSATVFSFYANKTMTTGEGGMVVTADEGLARRMRIMRLHGISKDAFDRFTARTPSWYYEVVAPGYKYNMTDVAAAMGRVQLGRAYEMANRRTTLAQRYFAELQGLPLLLPPNAPSSDRHAWHIFALRLDVDALGASARDKFIQFLADAGIGTSVHYIPLHRQPYWRDTYGLNAEDFPCADHAYHRLVSLPLYSALTDDQQTRIVETVHQAVVQI